MNERIGEPTYITYGLVEDLLKLHDFHCVFELDAPMKIFTRLMAAEFYTYDDILVRAKEFIECWHQSEIYCPHEGIDRRSEYGMEMV
jgi:hypothetical protein